MRDLKSDIIHAIYQCSGVDNEKLVDVSNICDKFQSRLDAAENIAMVPCNCWFVDSRGGKPCVQGFGDKCGAVACRIARHQ